MVATSCEPPKAGLIREFSKLRRPHGDLNNRALIIGTPMNRTRSRLFVSYSHQL